MTAFTELPEAEATGRIAEIYAEIRHFYGVPYVSSLQRHLATLPGVLEWAWDAVRPAFACGVLPERAWALAAEVDLRPLPKLSTAALSIMGVDKQTVETIRTVCRSFETVAPLNMAMGGTVRALLHGADTSGTRPPPAWEWRPQHRFPNPPATLRLDAVSEDVRMVLLQLATDMDGETFVPGLYRQLAHWPAYMAHIATELGPLFEDAVVATECHGVRRRITAAVPEFLSVLPPVPPPPANAPAEHILAAIETYQVTSPQMICFGRLLREALPD